MRYLHPHEKPGICTTKAILKLFLHGPGFGSVNKWIKIVTAYMFCTSRVWSEMLKFLKEFTYYLKGIFVRFMTMWKK